MKEKMKPQDAINHIVSSTRYWSNDTNGELYYEKDHGIIRAFQFAVWHVKNCHGAILCEREIDIARKELGL